MGQFKPMVKMMTTEPTVELKLAKGGAVAMKKGGSTTKAKKMAVGGLGGMSAPAMPSNMPAAMPAGPAPKKPSLASRRKAMMAAKSPVTPVMKKGGKVHEDEAEDRAMIKKALAGKKFKTGGVVMGQGGFAEGGVIKSTKGETKMHTASPDRSPAKTGGVKDGNGGGYKKGGMAKYAKGGGVEGNVSTTPAGKSNTTTGEVKKANAGGYKKGGSAKKFADGGSVQDDGRAVKMPQGSKRPPSPVRITQLSGTYRKGGDVKKKYAGGGMADVEADHASAAESQAYKKFYEDEKAENEATRRQFMNAVAHPIESIKKLPGKLMQGIDALRGKPESVTKTRESVTVTPGKKRGGRAC